MPSMPCYHCGKAKACKMYREANRETGALSSIYLCAPCARALTYTEPSKGKTI